MSQSVELILLLIIKKNGIMSSLLEQGFSYSQLSLFLKRIEKSKYARFRNKKLYVTKAGNARINYLQNRLAHYSGGGMILPEIKSKIAPISANHVYLPEI
jgi:hypothetical protein